MRYVTARYPLNCSIQQAYAFGTVKSKGVFRPFEQKVHPKGHFTQSPVWVFDRPKKLSVSATLNIAKEHLYHFPYLPATWLSALM